MEKLIVTRARPITLANQKQLVTATNALAEQCKIMRAIFVQTGTPPLRDFTSDFAGLAKIITGQQLSIASAAAIWSRVSAAIQPFDAAHIVATPNSTLAALGFSGAKIRTLKAVATAIAEDGFDMAALARVSDATVIERLTSLHGIGPWTADIYLLFALRRADAFPTGDLALQQIVQRLMKLETRPTSAQLADISERWRPWRGAAARLLWAECALRRQRAAQDKKSEKSRSR